MKTRYRRICEGLYYLLRPDYAAPGFPAATRAQISVGRTKCTSTTHSPCGSSSRATSTMVSPTVDNRKECMRDVLQLMTSGKPRSCEWSLGCIIVCLACSKEREPRTWRGPVEREPKLQECYHFCLPIVGAARPVNEVTMTSVSAANRSFHVSL